MSAVVYRNLRLADGRSVDVRVDDGRISAIEPGIEAAGAAVVAGGGHLALPGLVDGHAHLDKTFSGLPWIPHAAGPDLQSRVETEKRLRNEAGLPVRDRAAVLLGRCVGHGTTAMRTHVDIDLEVGLDQLHEVLRVRESFAARVDLQIVAFPQSGVTSRPGIADLLDRAVAEGADLVGGLDPAAVDGGIEDQLDAVFGIAVRRGVGLDFHLHDAGPTGLAEIEAIAARTLADGLAGRVTLSHAFSLGAAGEDDLNRTADRLAEAGVTVATHGAGARPIPPIDRLVERGVAVVAGNDNVRDAWSPFGTGDMLERAMLVAWRSGFRTDVDLATVLDAASGAGARALGFGPGLLAVGAPADFFTVDAQTPAEAVASRPPRTLVIKAGRVVARDGVLADGD